MASIEVASDTNPEVLYRVDPDAGTCTCPQYTQRMAQVNADKAPEERLVCKHVRRLREKQERAA